MPECNIAFLTNIYVTYYLFPFHVTLFIYTLYAIVIHFRELIVLEIIFFTRDSLKKTLNNSGYK